MKRVLFVLLLVCRPAGAADVTLSFGKPAEVGMDPVILEAGVNMYRQAVERDDVRGAVLLVARKGKVVLHEAVGWKDRELGLPMGKDSMFRMASNTKPVVATGIAILAERGRLKFDDPVHRHIKAFDNERAREITVHHLLTHTSGLRIKTIFLTPLVEKSPEHPDAPSLRVEVDRIAQVGPEEPVGKSYSYNNAGYNSLGAVLEAASGQALDDFLRQEIYEPLGMKDSYHHEVAEKLDGKIDRMCTVYHRSEGKWVVRWKPGQPPQYPFVRASGGMISTALDYAAFCQMHLNGGVYGGKRILKKENVDLMSTPHTRSLHSPEEWSKNQRLYGYGWYIFGDGVFGHFGSDGTAAWIDQKNELIVLVLTQSPGDTRVRERFFRLAQLAIDTP